MSVRANATAQDVAAATRTLAQLNAQAETLRAEIARLQNGTVNARPDSPGEQASHLVEANEQLVLAALHAQTTAATAMSSLSELARSSQRDALTDTPNRALMFDRMELALAMARRHQKRIAVIFLDVDRFKEVNDTFGHAAGDEVLQLVARRLESVVRDTDTVSRHGGDEFLVLLNEVSQATDAALVATKMLSAISEASRIGDHVLHLTASLGIAVYPEDGDSPEALIERADAAMYRTRFLTRAANARNSDAPRSAETAPNVLPQPATPLPSPRVERDPRLQDLRAANEQLVIAALNAQEAVALLEADAKEAHYAQIKFLATVAHELHNPLAPIRTAAELLPHESANAPMLAQIQAVIKRQVAFMTKLIDDLLDGSRLRTGKFHVDCTLVEIADVLESTLEVCQPVIAMRRQRLAVQQPAASVRVQGDAMRLVQVFSNLLDNASKFTADEGQLSVSVGATEHAVTITVADNGIGIAEEALPYIFDLFVQEPRVQVLHKGGLGIGLAVVRDLTEAHGGTVVGKSAGPGRGSEFVVTLPLAEVPSPA